MSWIVSFALFAYCVISYHQGYNSGYKDGIISGIFRSGGDLKDEQYYNFLCNNNSDVGTAPAKL